MPVAFKRRFSWENRNPISYLALADESHASSTNPASFFLDKSIDIISADGQAHFMDRMDERIATALPFFKKANAQGVIAMALEGGAYGTYLGSPDIVRKLYPWLVPILARASKQIRAAGLKFGCCIRHEEWSEGLTAGTMATPASAFETLYRKLWYARYESGWKCTLAYIDSNVEGRWGTPIAARIFQWLHHAFPDVLIIPEHTAPVATNDFDPMQYEYAAGYQAPELGHFGTPASVRKVMPDAVSVINVNGAAAQGNPDAIRASVAAGDILAGDLDFDSPAWETAMRMA